MKYQISNIKYQKYILNIKNVFSFCFVVLIFAFSFFRFVYGQQVSLAISPPLLELVIKPGRSVLIAYKLENRGDPIIALAKVLPFEARDNLGNIKIKNEFEGPVRFNLDNSEIKLNQPFFLKTGDITQLLLRIRVPEGAPEGDYYYTLLTETQPPPTKAGTSSGRAKATIGSNIIITVSTSGKIDIKGKVALFSTIGGLTFGRDLRIFDSNDKIPVVLIVDNKGNNVIKPQGEIILRGNFGEKANFEIIPQNILAQSQRLVLATPSAELNCPGPEKNPPNYCKQPITLLLSGFFLGHYTLSMNADFGQGTPNVYASTSFLAIPVKLIIGIIFALAIGVLIIKKFTKTDEE